MGSILSGYKKNNKDYKITRGDRVGFVVCLFICLRSFSTYSTDVDLPYSPTHTLTKQGHPTRIYRDQSLPFRKFQPEKRLPKILGDLFRVKIRLKWAIIPFFRCSKILGQAGKQEILQQTIRKFSSRLPNRYFSKSDDGCP